MGFMSSLGRLVSGKPMYTPEDINKQEQQRTAELTPGTNAGKIVPIVRVGRVECFMDGSKMKIYAYVENESQKEVHMDKITLFGHRHELDKPIKAGDTKQFQIYSGPALTRQEDERAELIYKDIEANDYFNAHHYIHYRREDSGHYIITELKLELPIYDMQY